MTKNSDKTNGNVARRRFITLAGSFLGVTGASGLLMSGSADAAENTFPKELHESITAYGTKVGKDKKELASLRKELDKLLKSFRSGQDLEKSCRTLIDGRPELMQIVKPHLGSNDPPSCIIFILILIIVIIVVAREE